MRKRICMILAAVMLCCVIFGCTKKTELETGSGSQTSGETVTVQESKADAEKETAAETAAETEAVSEGKESEKLLTNADIANFEFNRDNFPGMDGSTSMVPLGRAVASVLLGEDPEEVSDLVSFNKTTQSFRNLKNGCCDLLIVGEPNAAVFEEMKEDGFEYELEEIATDGLIFVVNKNNPVDNLTTDQIRDIYSGKITNWQQVGGNDAPIVPFQRNEGAGSQALMKKLVMKDTPLTEAPSTLVASEMGELMEAVKSYDNSANAIGYSVYYYANDMKKAEGLKLISVDGVEPSAQTIRSREYPHLNAYYCVIDIRQPKTSSTRVLYNWLMSKDGQALIAAEGYVAAKDPAELETELPGGIIVKTDYSYYRQLAVPENKFTRLSDGELNSLKAGKDYGFLYPYRGSVNYVNDEDGYSYEGGSLMGFFDENARLITDPIYTDIEALGYYEPETYAWKKVPVWSVYRPASEERLEVSFVAMDGSYVCDSWYETIDVNADRIICRYADYSKFDVYDLKGKKVFSSDQTDLCKSAADGWIGVSYGDGFYEIDLPEEGAWYVKESDRSVLGPYSYGMPFDSGLAIAGDPQHMEYPYSYGVIGQNGEWVIKPEYEQITRLGNGNFICFRPDNIKEIRNRNGSLIRTVEMDYISVTEYGFSGVNAEEQLVCCDFGGKVLFEDRTGEWNAVGKNSILYRKLGAGVQLWNLNSRKEDRIYVEGAEEAAPFYRIDDSPEVERFVVRNSYYDSDVSEYYVHERVFGNDLEQIFDGKDVSLHLEEDAYTGDWYFLYYRKGNSVCISDVDFRESAVISGYPYIVNGKFIVSDEYACTCYDKEGKIRFSYSLINSQGD